MVEYYSSVSSRTTNATRHDTIRRKWGENIYVLSLGNDFSHIDDIQKQERKRKVGRPFQEASEMFPNNPLPRSTFKDQSSNGHSRWETRTSRPFASRFDTDNGRPFNSLLVGIYVFANGAKRLASDSYTVGEFHTRPARNAGESASVGEVGKGIKAFVKFLSCIFPFFSLRFCFVSFRFVFLSHRRLRPSKGRSIYFKQGLVFFCNSSSVSQCTMDTVIHPFVELDFWREIRLISYYYVAE